MVLSRLYQPRNPAFWCLLALNALSTGLLWLARSWPLNAAGLTIVLLLALGNALIGGWLAWRLVRS